MGYEVVRLAGDKFNNIVPHPKKMMKEQYHRGFSLIELMIALVIVGILASIAYPAYQESVRRGSRSDCQATLLDVANRQERFFFDNNTYTVDLTDLGYGSDDDVSTPENKYTFDVDAATGTCPIATCYVLRCEGVGGQAADGDLTLDSTGEKLPADKW